jgi:putative ABC transport system permease protein
MDILSTPMKTIPVIRAALGGLSGRRVQTIVIGLVVGFSAAASTLALGLVVDSNAPFDHAFSAQHGANVTATVAGASPAQLAATTHLAGVTASAGPFPETTVSVTAQVTPSIPVSGGHAGKGTSFTVHQSLTLVGRSSPGGPVDDLTLTSGHWPTGPGQIVLSGAAGLQLGVGSQVTVSGVAGSPKLTVVGIATSVTGTAQGWVAPSEIAALEKAGAPAAAQMLYDFSGAGTASAVSKDVGAITAALPHGSVLGSQSWLAAKAQATSSFAPWVPFIVAFGLIGLVMSVLIVINVVSGAVVAGIKRIGVLKSLGFSPPQVVAAYVLQVTVPAVIACAVGAAAGTLAAGPMLGQTAQVYGVGTLAMPLWVSLAVPLVMLGLVGLTASAIALRAGRMSAVQAIATGRAPRPRHGYGALRLLGRGPLARLLPRPVSIGLAGPFARPTRTLVTMAAIVSGVTAVIFGFGLGASLDRVQADLSRTSSQQVQVLMAGHDGPVIINGQTSAKLSLAQQEQAVQAALHAQPGTQHYVAESDGQVSVLGLSDQLSLTGFAGDASWTGYAMISGHWYSAPGQVDVNTAFLDDTGAKVGQDYTLTSGGKHVTVQIAGEVFDPAGGMPEMIGATSTLSAVDPGLSPHYLLELAPSTNVGSYVNTLSHALGVGYDVSVNHSGGAELPAVVGLVAMLTVVIAVVAGLGVLNTVVLQTRERVHDLGVFKALGMTPRQTITMVISTVAGIGLAAGLIAIPAGVALHQYVVPVMGHAVQTDLPPAVLDVYHAPELVLLALSGVVIAVAGALAPAGWAARTRTAFAIRAE